MARFCVNAGRSGWATFALSLLAGCCVAGCSGGGKAVGPPAPPEPLAGGVLFVSDRDGRQQLYSMAANGTRVQRWTSSTGRDVSPAWSPDRSRVAFVSDRTGVSHVFVAAADGSNPRDLTPGSAVCGAPTWSPDGAWLACVQWEPAGAEANIRLIRADGSEARALTSGAGINGGPVWTKDGLIYFTTNRERGGMSFDLYVMDETGADPRKVAAIPGLMGRPALSPNGRQLVYAALVGPETPGLFVMDTRGQQSAMGGRAIGPTNSAEPAWAPDGRTLLFTSWKDGNAEVYSMDASGGSVKRLTTSPAADGGASW
jgi:Tol biopolymer transport system component